MRRLEYVSEHAPDIDPGAFVRVNAKCPETKVERPDVVEAEDVIGVTVRYQDCVEAFQAVAQCLLAKVGRGIDEYDFARVFDDDGNSQTFIARIVRGAGLAFTTD